MGDVKPAAAGGGGVALALSGHSDWTSQISPTAITIARVNASGSAPACCGATMVTMGMVAKAISVSRIGSMALPCARIAKQMTTITAAMPK